MKNNDNLSGINGWIVFLCLVTVAFSQYYLWFYPLLSSSYETGYWSTNNLAFKISCGKPDLGTAATECKKDDHKDKPQITYRLRAPRYLSGFVDRQMELTVFNRSDAPITSTQIVIHSDLIASDQITGSLALKETSSPLEIKIKEEDGDILNQSYFTVNIPAQSSQTYDILARLPIAHNSTDVKYARVVISEGNQPLAWDRNMPGRLCELMNGQPPAKSTTGQNSSVSNAAYICMENNPYAALRHSAIENLLLPPWANGVLPLFVFGIVFAVEHIVSFEPSKGKPQSEGAPDSGEQEDVAGINLPHALTLFLISLLALGILGVVTIKVIFDTDNLWEAMLIASIVPLLFFIWPRASRHHLRSLLRLVALVITISISLYLIYPWVWKPIGGPNLSQDTCTFWRINLPGSCILWQDAGILWVFITFLLLGFIWLADQSADPLTGILMKVDHFLMEKLKNLWAKFLGALKWACLTLSRLAVKNFKPWSEEKTQKRLVDIQQKVEKEDNPYEFDRMGEELDQIKQRLQKVPHNDGTQKLYQDVVELYKKHREKVEAELKLAAEALEDKDYKLAYKWAKSLSSEHKYLIDENGETVEAEAFRERVRSLYISSIKAQLDGLIVQVQGLLDRDLTEAGSVLKKVQALHKDATKEDSQEFENYQNPLEELEQDVSKRVDECLYLTSSMGEIDLDGRIHKLQTMLRAPDMTGMAAQLLAQAYLEKAFNNLAARLEPLVEAARQLSAAPKPLDSAIQGTPAPGEAAPVRIDTPEPTESASIIAEAGGEGTGQTLVGNEEQADRPVTNELPQALLANSAVQPANG